MEKKKQLICCLLLRGVEHPKLYGQIVATAHNLGPEYVAKEGKSPYFREV